MILTAGAHYFMYISDFLAHISLKNAVLVLKMTAMTRPFQQALDEWCEIASFAVIMENPGFG